MLALKDPSVPVLHLALKMILERKKVHEPVHLSPPTRLLGSTPPQNTRGIKAAATESCCTLLMTRMVPRNTIGDGGGELGNEQHEQLCVTATIDGEVDLREDDVAEADVPLEQAKHEPRRHHLIEEPVWISDPREIHGRIRRIPPWILQGAELLVRG